jgi:hypothetical protein
VWITLRRPSRWASRARRKHLVTLREQPLLTVISHVRGVVRSQPACRHGGDPWPKIVSSSPPQGS